MRARITVKHDDTDKYRKSVSELQKHIIAVGIFKESGKDLVKYAATNEFGAIIRRGGNSWIIPRRSFLVSTFNENLNKVLNQFKSIKIDFRKGDANVVKKLKLIGLQQESAVRQKITNLKTPRNRPSTIKRKGSSNPLIDSGIMRGSIKYKLIRKI